MQDGKALDASIICASTQLFAAAANCLRCHVTSLNHSVAPKYVDKQPSPILDHLPRLVHLAGSFLHSDRLKGGADACTTDPNSGFGKAACSRSDAAHIVQLLEAAALLKGCQQAGEADTGKSSSAAGQHLRGADLACSLDELLQTQLSLLNSPVRCPWVRHLHCHLPASPVQHQLSPPVFMQPPDALMSWLRVWFPSMIFGRSSVLAS